MQKRSFILSLVLLLSILNANANRAMYVDGFENILGDVSAENTLLSYAQANDIETLLLYGLHIVHANHDLPNPATNVVLADFIAKAKTTYGILKVGATSESANSFTNVIDAYNNSRTDPLEKFDIYNLEFEYWISSATGPGGYYCTNYLTPNGLPCTEAGAFQLYLSILKTMKSLAANNTHPITTEAYVGWPSAAQADSIGANLDNLRLHAYISDPNTAFSYSENRLIDFANGNPGLDVSIIYSSEPVFMQSWLENNSMLAAENIYTTDWMNGSSGWANNINLEGFTYFTYSDMLNVAVPVELRDFYGRATKSGIQLNWETSSETNSDYFEIERRNNNTQKFNALGKVESKGNSTSAIAYQFLDTQPNTGTNYYRLKQMDHNGQFHYSNTIAITYANEKGATKIYPSLTRDHIFIESTEKVNQVFIYNTNGQKIKERSVIDPILTRVDVGDLISGVYLVVLKSEGKLETFRFVKRD